jgi:hypothetical protein
MEPKRTSHQDFSLSPWWVVMALLAFGSTLVAQANPNLQVGTPAHSRATQEGLAKSYGMLPLSFEANRGQAAVFGAWIRLRAVPLLATGPCFTSWRRKGGRQKGARSAKLKAHRVGFALGPYPHTRQLDPTLGFSTYLGGLPDDEAQGLAVDTSDNVYVTGYTDSMDFPVTAGAYQPQCGDGCANGTYDAFVTKLNSSGTPLLYSTYLGGALSDYSFGIAVNSSGNAFIAGQTFSSDFP